MYSIAEIAKTFLTDHFVPLTSWVYSKQVTLTQAEIDASYWVAWGGTIDYNQVNRSISSVYLDYTLNLAEMDSLEDCQSQEESFYFDAVNQILYIHVTHTENPFAQTIETGLLFGYCSDKVRYFGNQEYKPILLSIPTITQSADPLQYDIMAFSGGSVVLSNDGEFDSFDKLYGNTIRLKIGKEGDDYTDLVTIFSGYIKDYTTTTKDITIDIGDNREKLQIEYPTQVLDNLTGLAEDSNGKIIPDGYGSVIQVPAYPIGVGTGEKELIFDGVNDYITFPSQVNPSYISVSVWVKTQEVQTAPLRHILGQGDTGYYGYWLGLKPDRITFSIGVGTGFIQLAGYKTPSIGQWNNICGTYDGTSVRLFLNGEELASYNLSGTINYGSITQFTIGNLYDLKPNRYFKGAMKDVRIFNRALTNSEVLDLYNNEPVTSGLINAWLLNEEIGTAVVDSASANNGTISGATWAEFIGVIFRWGSSVTSITQVYVEQDDKLTSVAHSDFSTSGTFTLSDTNAYIDGDNTKGLRKVYVTGVMRNLTNPADIIVDLNARLANIQYNSTNYNIAEWETEKALLADVSLYMDNSKSLYDWISLLQSGSTWGFRYEDSGKRTIRLDDPDRPQITFDDGTNIITPVEIRNSDIPVNQNADLYATSCIVKYGYNHRTQSYAQVENTDYKDAVLQEHRIEKIITLESLLTSKADAEEKALRIMQDQSKVRPIITLELEVSKCTTPRIYDIIQAEASLLTRESRIPSVWSYVLGDMDILGDDLGLIGEVHKLTRTEAYAKNGSRLYFGTLKGQVIGIEPRTDTDSVILKIRERD
jgi:hypothetical protein